MIEKYSIELDRDHIALFKYNTQQNIAVIVHGDLEQNDTTITTLYQVVEDYIKRTIYVREYPLHEYGLKKNNVNLIEQIAELMRLKDEKKAREIIQRLNKLFDFIVGAIDPVITQAGGQ